MHPAPCPLPPALVDPALRHGESGREETEATLRALRETSPQPMWIYDAHTFAFLFVNDAAVYHYGYSRDQFLAMTILDIRPPEEIGAVRASMPEDFPLFRNAAAWHHRKGDGTIITVEVFTHEVVWEGRAARSALINDITVRSRLEGELRDREERYHQMFNNHGAVQLLIDPQSGEIVDANPAACAFYGYPRAVFTAMNIRAINLLPPTAVGETMVSAYTEGHGVFTFPHRLANGEMRDVEVRSGPVTSNGRALLFSIINDITDRTHAEGALRRSEANLAALHAVSLDLVNQLDRATILDVAVGRAATLLGTAHAHLALVTDDGTALINAVGLGIFASDAPSRRRKGEGVAGTVWETGQPLVVDDYQSWAGNLTAQYANHLHAVVAVPLVVSGRVLGVLGLAHTEAGRTFDAEALTLLVRFAALVTVALENARLYHGVQEEIAQRQRIETSLAVAQRIAHLGSWEWDIATGKERWSDERYRLVGLAPGSITPTHAAFLASVHPEDQERVAAGLETSIPGEPIVSQFRVVRPDGTVRVLQSESEVEHNAAGMPVRLIGTTLDITERKQAEEALHYLAYYDPLTGLPNRTRFNDLLAVAVRRAHAQSGQGVAVLFLDLDRFKTVNDSLGHQRGDHLLALVATRLGECVTPGVLVSRFGGDEFAVLLEGVGDRSEAIATAERLHAALSTPFRLRGLELYTTASIGIALGEVSRDAAMLLRDADIAMYRAKARGRGQTVVFDGGMRVAVIRRMMIENDLQGALGRGEFRLVYEPVILLATGAVMGFEALLRWDHPRMGPLAPAEFIPIVEETGFVVPLGEWVLRAACQELGRWRVQHPSLGSVTMNVNLSGSQVARPGLVERVAQILQETAIPATALHLEITERVLLDHTEVALETLTRLHAMGVQIELDDFGVEYSSLNYLRRFPITAIKIDRSFIETCIVNAGDREVVGAMVRLAHGLGIGVTAEGIECEEQQGYLRALGCEHGQGYYFAKPLTGNQALALLTARTPAM